MRKKICAMIFIAMVCTAGIASLAHTQEPRPKSNQTEIHDFDRFLDHHPRIADKLATNPTQVNDSDFLAHHPPLKEFLENHPALSANLKKAPGSIASKDGKYQWSPAKP